MPRHPLSGALSTGMRVRPRCEDVRELVDGKVVPASKHVDTHDGLIRIRVTVHEMSASGVYKTSTS